MGCRNQCNVKDIIQRALRRWRIECQNQAKPGEQPSWRIDENDSEHVKWASDLDGIDKLE